MKETFVPIETPRLIACFDCDSTLTKIEGIDWLAARRGRREEVAALTESAMSGAVSLEDVYAKRLARVRPSREDLSALAEAYRSSAVQDAEAVVGALTECGVEVWVVSGGLADAVAPFAIGLGVLPDRVQAVTIEWGEPDPYRSVEDHGLARSDGKREVIEELAEGAPVVLIGDGASDLEAREAVRCFIGFGGVVVREAVRDASDAWIESESLAPVVPMVTGEWGRDRLRGSAHAEVWDHGESLRKAGGARGGCPGLDVQEIVAS